MLQATLLPLCVLSLCLAQPPSPGVRQALKQADALAESGDHRRAARAYVQVLRDGELSAAQGPVAYFNLGLTLVELGEHAKAAAAFNSTVFMLKKGDPRRAVALVEHAEALSRVGFWAQAAAGFGAAAAASSTTDGPPLLRNRGNALLNLGDFAEALLAFRQAGALLPAGAAAPPLRATLAGEIGVALCHLRRPEEAAENLAAARAGDASGGRHMLVGFWLESCDLAESERHLSLAIELMRGNAAEHVQVSSAYYHLGAVLRALGRPGDERLLYDEAVRRGVWRDAMQRPGYVHPERDILARPFHDLADAAHAGAEWDDLRVAVTVLESAAEAVRGELLAALESGGPHEWPADDEGISARPSEWHHLLRVRNGHRVPPESGGGVDWDRALPASSEALDRIAGLPSKPLDGLPKGSVEFSVLAPGAALKPHCGPSNHRLRVHLAIAIPRGGVSEIRVGEGWRRWENSSVLIIDDSFEHEARVGPAAETDRVILMVDVWHPHLGVRDRSTIRDHFRWSESSWGAAASPWSGSVAVSPAGPLGGGGH